jgi:hypothetical protein
MGLQDVVVCIISFFLFFGGLQDSILDKST